MNTKTPAYRVELIIDGKLSVVAYDYKRHGQPTDSVAREIRTVWTESFKDGGANAHLGATEVSSVKILHNNAWAEVVASDDFDLDYFKDGEEYSEKYSVHYRPGF